jgi:hypothetical protein
MKPLLLLTVACLSVIAVSGCTAGPSQPDASVTGMPAKNLERWALPLDQFVEQSYGLRDYVENLMVSRCLGKQGVDWPAPWQPLDRGGLGPSITPGGTQLFDEKIAAQYGYHQIPVTYKGQAEWLAAFKAASAIVQRDPSVGPKFDACLEEVRKTVPLLPMEDLNYAFNSGLQIRSSSEEDAAVKAATKKWRTCIDAAGFGGLADSAEDMPGERKMAEWVSGGSEVSSEERRTATADAQCRTSSGWSQVLYDRQYAKQVTFVTKNADRLDRIRGELKKEREGLLAAASKYAPK